MPFRDPQLWLTDMLHGIEAIDSFLIGVNLSRYRSDLLVRSAVERQLQIIAEAAFRLGDEAVTLCPTVDWRGVRGLGNFLRHEYDEIDDGVIWMALQDQLPHLKSAAQDALARLRLSPQEESR